MHETLGASATRECLDSKGTPGLAGTINKRQLSISPNTPKNPARHFQLCVGGDYGSPDLRSRIPVDVVQRELDKANDCNDDTRQRTGSEGGAKRRILKAGRKRVGSYGSLDQTTKYPAVESQFN